jgi:hypothetical protein
MPLGLIARLRRHRGPAVLVVAGLMTVQAFFGGLAMAQAALMLSPNPADADFAVICHGNAGAGSDPAGVPEPARSPHPCCMSCVAGSPPATLPQQHMVLRPEHCPVAAKPLLCAASIMIAPRAVRAGASQAPPRVD